MKLMRITASSMPHKMTPSQQMIIKKGYSPYIGDTGTWYVYDDNKKHLWTLASKRPAPQGEKGAPGKMEKKAIRVRKESRARKEIQERRVPPGDKGNAAKRENQESKGCPWS